MPSYRIEQYELHTQAFYVEAAHAAAALAKLFAGQAEPIDNGGEYLEVAHDYGLPTAEFRELADALRALGVCNPDAIIPSIRSMEEL